MDKDDDMTIESVAHAKNLQGETVTLYTNATVSNAGIGGYTGYQFECENQEWATKLYEALQHVKDHGSD
jgi:hypothetical protein